MSTITIADNTDQLKADADQASRLHSATGMELAAFVWAWTYEGTNQSDAGSLLSQREFAQLGVRGLGSRNTVSKYRKLWQAAIDRGLASEVSPGDTIELPEITLDELQSLMKGTPASQTKEQWRKEQKSEPQPQGPPPKVEDIPDEDLGDEGPTVELTTAVKRFINRAEVATQDVEEDYPGIVGSSIRRLTESITGLVFEDDSRRSYLHALDALAELVAALNKEVRDR